MWKVLVKQSSLPRNALRQRLWQVAQSVSGAVEKWCITFGEKVWLSGMLSEFLFSATKASKKGEKVFHTH